MGINNRYQRFYSNPDKPSILFVRHRETVKNQIRNWGTHTDNITIKPNQTLGFLKSKIKVHNQDLKSTAYKTLIWPQLEYASINVNLFNAGLPGGATRDYKQTSSVTTMLGKPNWRPLDQRRIDNQLVMMYKCTYDLVAFPAYA